MKNNPVYTPVKKVPGRPGYYFNRFGYVLVHVKRGWFELEHRRIVEQVLGRKLKPDEEVNHINGLKYDNRNSNLFVSSRAYHEEWHRRCFRRFGRWHPPGVSDPRKLSRIYYEAGTPLTGREFDQSGVGAPRPVRKLSSESVASIIRESIGLY